MKFQCFSNGDRIWLSQRFGKPAVVKIVTNDGLFWEEGTSLKKLEGVEKFFLQVEVFFIKLFAKVLA